MIDSLKRKQMEDLVYGTFDALDKTHRNTNKYKKMFSSMTDAQFDKFFKNLFNDEASYLILDICDYEVDLRIEDIEKAAKFLKIPLYEKVYSPHFTMDKDNVICTKNPVPVGYCHIKRTQQTLAKKDGLSISAATRASMTGQVTRGDKNGRESDLENAMLVAWNADAILKELNGPRADDNSMKQQMYTEINNKGYVALNDLESDVSNKTTLNTINTYLLGMGVNSDLVTKGLMTTKTIKNDSEVL